MHNACCRISQSIHLDIRKRSVIVKLGTEHSKTLKTDGKYCYLFPKQEVTKQIQSNNPLVHGEGLLLKV